MHDDKTQLVEKGGSSFFFEKGSTITEVFLMGVTMWLNWWFRPGNFKILIANGAF